MLNNIWYDEKYQLYFLDGPKGSGYYMILINIDKNKSSEPLYKQIYTDIKDKILNNKFSSHEKLPSKRQLADQLNLSINTVTNAYEQLLAEGYIYTIERSGYFIEEITQFTAKSDEVIVLPDELKECEEEVSDFLSLSHMTADTSKFPFNEWLRCQRQALSNYEKDFMKITHPQGPYVVRETIAKLIGLTRGVTCVPEQIVISAGTQPLIKQLMAIQEKSPTIAVENPGYSRVHSLLTRINLDVQPISLDSNGIDIKKVKKSQANFVFVTPSHQFPTGTIMPISRRIELLNWAQKEKDRYIIEDDYDSEFKYQTDNIPSLQSLDKHQRVIYMGTFSKSLLPSLRISYMVLPIPFLKKYREVYSDLIPYNNTMTLYTLHYFIENGGYNRHIKRMNKLYELRRTRLIDELMKKFGNKVSINDIPAGLHFTATFNTKKSYAEVEHLAEKYKLEIYTIRRFLLTDKCEDEGPLELILGFANIIEEDIPEAVNRLYKVLFN